MLSSWRVRIAGALVGALALSGASPSPAFAGTGTGGNPGASGNTGTCTDSGVTVTCGSGVGGEPGNPAGTGKRRRPVLLGHGQVPPPNCPHYVTYQSFFGTSGGPPPPGVAQPGNWYVNTCAVGTQQGMATGIQWFGLGQVPGATATPPSPAVAAAEAESRLRLPGPALALGPAGTGYVNLPEWLALAPGTWAAVATAATACNAGGCVTAQARADPTSVRWSTGDGAVVTCSGPGNTYNPDLPAAVQHPTCSHVYTQPSLPGTPRSRSGHYTVTATVTWVVTWTGPGGTGGALPDLVTSASTSLRVAQIESVDT
jgi:hypothetical protein